MELEKEYRGYTVPDPRHEANLLAAGRNFSEDEPIWCTGWHCRSNCGECLLYPVNDPARFNAFADWLLSHGIASKRPGYIRELYKNFKSEVRKMGE